MVVVVVIVFNYTSPKFHKPAFSDCRQLYAFKENNKIIFILFHGCSQASISDISLRSQTRVPTIEMLTLRMKGSQEFWHY